MPDKPFIREALDSALEVNLAAIDVDTLRRQAERVGREHREQERAVARVHAALRELGKVASIDVEDLIGRSLTREVPELLVERLRARGIPELDAAAKLIEQHFAARRR